VMRAGHGSLLSSMDGRFQSRPLFPTEKGQPVEFYELRIKAGGRDEGRGQAAGTVKNIVVVSGGIELSVGDRCFRLGVGDSAQFNGDHPYRLTGIVDGDSLAYLVVSIPECQR